MSVDSIDPKWTNVREAFARIHESPPAMRPELLAALDGSMRDEVVSLLDAADRAPAFLRLPEDTVLDPGTMVGPYLLVEEIGRGGMGLVYRAERRDGEFTQQVAVKIAGGRLYGPDAERRFIQERQILAQLDHPHIVRLLDGGITDGRRYFVMELADGSPITEYCASRALGLRACVELFRDVCAAIHYAHQRLILHRDLKPGNILVTGDATVKVLDFGIAQIVQTDTVMSDASTTAHPFSISCASPEQLRGEPLSLSSDIYSLGVLLYELITGVNPQSHTGDSFEDVYRRVVDRGLPAPSSVAREVPRDLDAIVVKAVALRPADRYASVSELQADVDRWLSARPVLARTPSAFYVFGKLIRRHRGLAAMTAALLVLGTVGATLFVRQARIEQRRFEDARRLINVVVQDIQPKLEAIPATLPLRQVLIEKTMAYLESVSRDVGTNVPLMLELANAYAQLARVQGDITTSTLGNQNAAGERFRRAEALMQTAVSVAPADPIVLKDAALLYGRLAGFENTQGQSRESIAHAKQAVEFAERRAVLQPGDFDAREVLAFSVFYLGVSASADEWAFRVATLHRAGDLYRQLGSERPQKDNLLHNAAIVDRYLASLHNDKGHAPEARTFGERALAASERRLALHADDPSLRLEVATDAGMLATIVDAAGDLNAALDHCRRAIELNEAVLAVDPANARAKVLLAEATKSLARNRLRAGDVAQARQQAARSVEIFDSLRQAGELPFSLKWRYATAMATVADIEEADGRSAAACADYRRAVAQFDESEGQAPLVDLLKTEADRARSRVAACAGTR